MKLAILVFVSGVLTLVHGVGASTISFGSTHERCPGSDDGFEPIIEAAAVPGSANGWQAISCQDSPLVTPSIMAPGEKCSKAVRTLYNPAGEYSCRYDHYRARSLTPEEVGNVHAIILDKGFNDKCAVATRPGFATWFPHSSPILTKLARRWTAAPTISGASGMYFDFPRRHCYAFFLPGYAWGNGYTNVFIGFLCGPNDNSTLSTDRIRTFLGGLNIRYMGFR